MKARKRFLSLLLLATLVLPQVAGLRSANAVLAFDGGLLGFDPYRVDPLQGVALWVVCVVILPICILDQQAEGNTITKQDLLDNGYTEEEAELYFANQTKVLEELVNSNQKIMISPKDTAQTIAHDLRTIYPEANQLYIDTFLDFA